MNKFISHIFDEPVPTKDCVSTDTAQSRLKDLIHGALAGSENVLIEAPTSLGKTYLIATTPWREYPELTDGEPVVHLHQTREARDQAAEMSRDESVKHSVLRGREELCPVACGDFDDELAAPNGDDPSNWFHKMCDEQGYEFSRVHRLLRDDIGDLPCEQEGGCLSTRQWENIPRNEDGNIEYDVIHATHQFAHVPNLVDGANVAIDERPDYTLKTSQERIRQAANEFLEQQDPDENYIWEKLVTAVTERDEEILSEFRTLLSNYSRGDMPISEERAHKHIHTILRALVMADSVIKGRYTGKEGRISIVMRETDIRLIRQRPPLSDARCVVGLDAHPCKRLWEQNAGIDFQHSEVLNTEERKKWRRYKRGLSVIQIGENTRPLTRGWWPESNQEEKAKAIIRAIRRHHGDDFRTCISPASIESEIRTMMENCGVETPETMHYGEQNSRNDFGNEDVGLLLGCIGPSSDWILDMLAESGLKALPKAGRKFEGRDADAARAFLESVREENVAQAIGRYARDREASKQVTVYVWTNAIPAHLVDEQSPGVVSNITNKKSKMYQTVQEKGPVTATGVAETVDCTKEYVRQSFSSMEDRDLLTVSEGTGPYGADEYDTTGKRLLPAVEITKSGDHGSNP